LIVTQEIGADESTGDKAQGGKEGSPVSCVGDTEAITTNNVEGTADMVSNAGGMEVASSANKNQVTLIQICHKVLIVK
jgi:hypothetical protein